MSPKQVPLSRSGAAIRVSFEFFPPKTPEMEASLWEAARRLEPLDPSFVSVTYGAGGSTRERTHATVARLVRETTMKPAAHLTCVGASRGEIRDTLSAYHGAGVRHIVALRGDPPGGLDAPYEASPEGYRTTAELVADAKEIGNFEVSVGTYPEKHPQSPTLLHDIEMLKRKVGAGADRAITQFFFDNSVYFRFLDCRRAAGIDDPDRAGNLSDAEFQADGEFRSPRRNERAALARRAVRGPRRRSRHPPPRRRRRLRRTGDRPHRPRRRGFALLYDEPGRPRVRHLPSGRAEGEAEGGGASRTTRTAAVAAGSVVTAAAQLFPSEAGRVAYRVAGCSNAGVTDAMRYRGCAGSVN